MQALLNRTLILLAVIGIVFMPPVLIGYAELEKAESLMQGGNFSEAAGHYERSARLLPWMQSLLEKAGTANFFAGKFTDAIFLFERANQKNELSAEAWDWLGQSYWQKNDFESAQTSWDTGLDIYPGYTKYYANLSMAYFAQNDTSAEKQALELWVASGLNATAITHYRLGLLLILADPDRASNEFSIASTLESEYDSVVETLKTAIDLSLLETDESDRLMLIGRGLGLVNEWPLAVQAFRLAVELDGEGAEAWAWLGEAEQQVGRDGREDLDRAVSLDRENPIVRSLRGLYWTRQGKYSQALAEYLLAARYDPKNPARQFSIGEMYALTGDLPAALERYQRATEIAPTDEIAWRLLAAFCTKYNMQVEEIGLPAAQFAVELAGEDALTLDTLGWALTLLERYDEALETLKQALNLDPEFAQGHLHLGVVYLQLDDWEAALEHIQGARDLDVGGPVGEQAQVLLNQYFP